MNFESVYLKLGFQIGDTTAQPSLATTHLMRMTTIIYNMFDIYITWHIGNSIHWPTFLSTKHYRTNDEKKNAFFRSCDDNRHFSFTMSQVLFLAFYMY